MLRGLRPRKNLIAYRRTFFRRGVDPFPRNELQQTLSKSGSFTRELPWF